jgi:hypothetical protein
MQDTTSNAKNKWNCGSDRVITDYPLKNDNPEFSFQFWVYY